MAGSTEFMSTGLSINGYSICYVRIVPLIRYSFVNANDQIMCGTLDQLSARVLPGIQLHGWRILMAPHPAEWERLLPLIGYEELSADTWTPTDTLTEFAIGVRLKSSTLNVWTTSGCKVDKAIVRGQQGMNPVYLQLDCLGKTSTPDGGTWNPTSITVDSPYEFTSSSGQVSVNSTVRAVRSVVWAQDNGLQLRFNNSVTADVVANTQRKIHVGLDTPYTDDEDDILTTFTGSSREDGVPISAYFVHGNQQLGFSIPLAVWEAKPPSILSKAQDIRLDQYYLAIKGASAVCTWTQDPTT